MEILESEPIVLGEIDPNLLETWKKLGKLDLEEVNSMNPIDLQDGTIYLEERDVYPYKYGMFKNGKLHGLGREVYDNAIYEGQY